ncbi:g2832 [Coccomyxa elongata]
MIRVDGWGFANGPPANGGPEVLCKPFPEAVRTRAHLLLPEVPLLLTYMRLNPSCFTKLADYIEGCNRGPDPRVEVSQDHDSALPLDPGFRLDRFLAAASRWVLPKRLPHGRRDRRVRPTAVCVGASAAGGDTAAVDFTFTFSRLPFEMAPARLHAGIHRRRAAGLNADDDATP